MCNVYRRFVPNFAQRATPLNALLTKGQPAELASFGPKELEAFEDLKGALTTAPVLRLPRDDLPISIETDASDFQVGVVLLQKHEDGENHPVGYWSGSLLPSEKNNSTPEKDWLALIWTCQILTTYVEGRIFTAYKDHNCLRWLFKTQPTSADV